MTVEELLARESIRHAIATYNISGDSQRPEGLAGVFTDDGIYEFAGFGPVPGWCANGRAGPSRSLPSSEASCGRSARTGR